jgi:hypothetical protein
MPREFSFPKIELEYKIINPKTMMIHHTWIWHLINITDHPLDEFPCAIEGPVRREFVDLNVSVKDEENKNLKILSVNANKPFHKEFVVKLNKPLKPNQRRRLLKLEYDWEEVDGYFFFTLQTDCKRLTYLLTAPKEMDLKPQIHKLDPITGWKLSATPPEINYLKKGVAIRWHASNLQAHDELRFGAVELYKKRIKKHAKNFNHDFFDL